jgi:hypothetical protein
MRKNQYGFDIYIAGIPAMVRDARALPAVLIIRIRLKEPKGRCRLRRFSPQQFQQEISPPSFRKDFCDHLPGLSGITINKWRDGFADPSRRPRFKIDGRRAGIHGCNFPPLQALRGRE